MIDTIIDLFGSEIWAIFIMSLGVAFFVEQLGKIHKFFAKNSPFIVLIAGIAIGLYDAWENPTSLAFLRGMTIAGISSLSFAVLKATKGKIIGVIEKWNTSKQD